MGSPEIGETWQKVFNLGIYLCSEPCPLNCCVSSKKPGWAVAVGCSCGQPVCVLHEAWAEQGSELPW